MVSDRRLYCLMSTGSLRSGSLETKSPAGRASTFPPGPAPEEPVTPPSKAGRRSFWDMLVMGEWEEVVKLASTFLLPPSSTYTPLQALLQNPITYINLLCPLGRSLQNVASSH